MEFLGGISLLLVLVLAIIFMDKIIDFVAFGIYSISYLFTDENSKQENDANESLDNVKDSV